MIYRKQCYDGILCDPNENCVSHKMRHWLVFGIGIVAVCYAMCYVYALCCWLWSGMLLMLGTYMLDKLFAEMQYTKGKRWIYVYICIWFWVFVVTKEILCIIKRFQAFIKECAGGYITVKNEIAPNLSIFSMTVNMYTYIKMSVCAFIGCLCSLVDSSRSFKTVYMLRWYMVCFEY